MELIRLLAALRRRLWLLVQAVVLFTVAGGLSAWLLPKEYETTARLMVSSSDATSAVLSDLGLQELAVGLSGESDDIQNHIALMTTRPLLEELIWRLQLRDSDGALLPPDKLLVDPPLLATEITPHIEVRQHQSTDLVQIVVSSDDPLTSQLMADTLAQVYISETQERSQRETREARDFVEGRLEIVQGEFDRALSDIADVQEQERIIDLDSEVRSAVSRLSELMLMSEETTGRLSEVNAQIAELRSLQGQEEVDWISPATMAENSELRGLREDMTELRMRRVALLLDLTERHPDVIKLDEQIEALEQELGSLLAQQHGMDPTLVQLQVESAGLQDRTAAIQAAIERTTETFSQYPDKMRRLSQLELAATAAEEVYTSLQSQSYQIAVAEAMTASPIQFIEPATRPDRHKSPKLVVNLVTGMGLGILVGLGLVFLFEYIDDSVREPSELQEIFDEPLLASLPRYKAGVGTSIADLSPTDPVAEAFRTLRSAIQFAEVDSQHKALCVTSSLPGEGKSTVVANLGVSLAREGLRTLIVDCDLRRPTQHSFWASADNRVGLTQVLLGKESADKAIQQTGVEGLSLLSSGPIPPNPGSLVESLRLRQLLLELSRDYDFVLVDVPPALVVNDALLVAQMVGAMVVVVESGQTSRRIVEDTRQRLAAHELQPVGLVLNKVDFQGPQYKAYAKAYKAYGNTGAA
ncbi:MAG: polysaccharide biosynthesis tyrosine autokinase [Myxococcota bacterium]|nr:polysaccharide biosynthesis tyrosine autokinase [Myxococcota bacterium]